MKKVLIVGVNFANKGAQSMLFTLTDEIKKRNENAEVLFGCNNELYDENKYKFVKIHYSLRTQCYALKKRISILRYSITISKDLINILRKKKKLANFGHDLDLRKIISEIDLIIDASGYALADFSSKVELDYYLNTIRIAKNYSIPVIVMPQSFGPFSRFSTELKFEIGNLLRYASIIFARETEGKQLLELNWNLTNVKLSPDLVLQNKEINIGNILNTSDLCFNIPDILPNSVCIIPNYHCFEKECKNSSFKLYHEIINMLCSLDFNVYIARHSSADNVICSELYKHNINQRVHLIDRDFSCLEYDQLVKKFDFIICSRFHGCVHAYKNSIPCIILGWAIKYVELAKHLKQDKYVFDISYNHINFEEVLEAIESMSNNRIIEKKVIKESLEVIQNDTCFSVLDSFL